MNFTNAALVDQRFVPLAAKGRPDEDTLLLPMPAVNSA